ncbi:MAG: hypothetical protein ACRDL2_00260 [Gaiellaceae bacterium]
MKLTVVRAIPLVLAIAIAAFFVSGVHRFKEAHHGFDAVVGEAAWLGFLVAALALIILVAVALRRRRHAAIVSACVCALALAAVAGAALANAATSVTVTLGSRGPTISGPTRWHPGPVRIAAASRLPDQELVLLHFRPGYSYAQFQADSADAQGHAPVARTALARVFAHTIFDGGVNVFPGTPASFTVDVRPATYYLGELVRRPELTAIHVAGQASTAQSASAGVITATDAGYRLGATLPAHGTITIRNAGTQLHRLNLIPVKRGTTRAQLAAYLRKTGGKDNAPPPAFALKGAQLGTSDISPNGQMQLTYHLPAGEYALLDFNHDMKTGRPDTLEGVYAVVTLR